MGAALSCILFRPPLNARAGDSVRPKGVKGCWPPTSPRAARLLRQQRKSLVNLRHPRYKHVISIDDGLGQPLSGFHINAGCPLTLFFCHGNAEDLDMRTTQLWLKVLHRTLGVDVFAFEYAGYGASRGDQQPSERQIYRDSERAFRYLTSVLNVESRNIVLYGRSLGAVVACHLARVVTASQPQAIETSSSLVCARVRQRPASKFSLSNPHARQTTEMKDGTTASAASDSTHAKSPATTEPSTENAPWTDDEVRSPAGVSVLQESQPRMQLRGVIVQSIPLSAYRVAFRNLRATLPGDCLVTIDNARHIQCPVLFVHGTDDNLIPIKHGQKLWENVREEYRVEPLWIDGGGHNDIEYNYTGEVLTRIDKFVNIETELSEEKGKLTRTGDILQPTLYEAEDVRTLFGIDLCVDFPCSECSSSADDSTIDTCSH